MYILYKHVSVNKVKNGENKKFRVKTGAKSILHASLPLHKGRDYAQSIDSNL